MLHHPTGLVSPSHPTPLLHNISPRPPAPYAHRCLMRYVHCLLDASHNSHHTQRVQHKPALFLYPSLYTSDNLRSVDTQLAAVGTACLSRASFPGSFPTCYQLLHAFETIDATLLRNTRLRQLSSLSSSSLSSSSASASASSSSSSSSSPSSSASLSSSSPSSLSVSSSSASSSSP